MTLYTILTILTISTCTKAVGQNLILPTENIKFSFSTIEGKIVSISGDKNDKYLVYRYGVSNKPEFQFPVTLIDTWKQFSYSFYLRGGGTDNEGMDLNYLYFTNGDYKYVIYDTYYARTKKHEIGIKIINIKTGKVTLKKGSLKSQKGTLVDFRDNDLISKGDDLFE